MVSSRLAFVSLAVVSAMFVTLALAMSAIGISHRSGPGLSDSRQVQMTQAGDSKALLSAWENAKVRGLNLVRASESAGFLAAEVPNELKVRVGYPVALIDTRDMYRQLASRDNVVRIALYAGYIRSYVQLMPGDRYLDQVAWAETQGIPGVSADKRFISGNNDGFIRTITASPQPTLEPVLLDVDASYFATGTVQELLRQLNSAGYTYAMVTYNDATDDPEVTDEMRARLDEFRVAFSGGAAQ